jgi:tyrosyl-tRNA synthetase
VDFAKLIYPIMQVADIFAQDLTLAHSGMDQRKAHVVMRDVADKMSERNNSVKEKKPVALHHHLLLGLGRPSKWPLTEADIDQDFWGDMKMSKSKPDTAIFIHDKAEEIERKINKAFCPEGEIAFNPVLDWTKHLIFPIKNKLQIERAQEHGGNKEYVKYGDLEFDFKGKQLHPVDLKQAVAKNLIAILEPAREHFAKGKNKELLASMLKLTVTR